MQFVAAGSTVHRPEVTVKYCALVKPTIMSRKAPHVGESILSEANARMKWGTGTVPGTTFSRPFRFPTERGASQARLGGAP